jgi:hypothetical protein
MVATPRGQQGCGQDHQGAHTTENHGSSSLPEYPAPGRGGGDRTLRAAARQGAGRSRMPAPHPGVPGRRANSAKRTGRSARASPGAVARGCLEGMQQWWESTVGSGGRGAETRPPVEEYARSRAAGKRIAGRGRGFSHAGGQTVAPARTGGGTQGGKAGTAGIKEGNGSGPSAIPAARRSMDDAGGVRRREALHRRGGARRTGTAWGRRGRRAAGRRRTDGWGRTAVAMTGATTRHQQGCR